MEHRCPECVALSDNKSGTRTRRETAKLAEGQQSGELLTADAGPKAALGAAVGVPDIYVVGLRGLEPKGSSRLRKLQLGRFDGKKIQRIFFLVQPFYFAHLNMTWYISYFLGAYLL